MLKYLQAGDRVFATGVHLKYDGSSWIVGEFEDDTYFDGALVNFNFEGLPYVCNPECKNDDCDDCKELHKKNLNQEGNKNGNNIQRAR